MRERWGGEEGQEGDGDGGGYKEKTGAVPSATVANAWEMRGKCVGTVGNVGCALVFARGTCKRRDRAPRAAIARIAADRAAV